MKSIAHISHLHKVAMLLLVAVLFLFSTSPVNAQFKSDTDSTELVDQEKSKTLLWHAGLEFAAGSRACLNVLGTAPAPANWPEQKVRVIKEETTPGARLSYRDLPNSKNPQVKQLVASTGSVRPGSGFRAVVTFEVERFAQLPPENTTIYTLPDSKKLPLDMRIYLMPSPGIESNYSKMRSLFNEITADHDQAWEKVEAIYDWVRDNITYRDEKKSYKGAVKAITDGYADCEDLTGAFIAICRAGNIPARTVWVHEHCYPEFYLLDDKGEGHWFPCQVAGSYAFGGMPDLRVILQKGDRIRTPEHPREEKRYCSEYLKMSGGVKKWHKFIHQLEIP